MKLEIFILGITAFFIANAYHDNKYINYIKMWKKYYQIGFFALIGLSIYIFIKKNPAESGKLLQHANGIIKYMPIDKNSADLLSPILNYSSNGINAYSQNQNQNGAFNRLNKSGSSNGGTKRSVSETKKKYVASSQDWKCGNCNNQLEAWFEIDHKIRLDCGGNNHINNLVALCRNCHGEKTAMENM